MTHAHASATMSREQTTENLVSRLHGLAPTEPQHVRDALVADLIVANAPVARRIARKFEGRGCDADDLEQTAYLALVRAAQRFDASRGYDFLSYAVPCITGEVKRLFRDHGWMVRPPRPVQELQARVEDERVRPDPATGRPASEHDVADRLDVPVQAVRQAMQARGCFSPTSLDRTVPGTVDLVLADTLVDSTSSHAYDAADARAVLGPLLSTLGAADRRLLQWRFVDELTQQQIGRELGVSQSQVSRSIQTLLERLRGAIDDSGSSRRRAA